ncbi:MAG: EF-P lysine aminoacylase EpmA [Alphaproteobacteria bacterium]|nr:EF-P lysine aminoacylase EpmA [Alphaproteobacteria bacterium]
MTSSQPASRWWSKTALDARRPGLQVRDRVRRALRGFFDREGFVEVETPALQVSPGMEPHLSVFETSLIAPGRGADPERETRHAARRFLHTSPEFAMKKLLAGGEEAIWQWARVFRNAEGSATHQPEFVMIEWYRAQAGYTAIMEDCESLLKTCAVAGPYRRGALACDPALGCARLTVEEAFRRHAGIDLRASYGADPSRPDASVLRAQAASAGVRTDAADGWDDVFFRIMDERIEPNLGVGRPTILTDYPISMAALARPKPDDPMLAERFELYVCGVELANAFGELSDAAEQRRRFEADAALTKRLYDRDAVIDEDFLDAVAALPSCAGIALGFDRLVMLACGAEDLRDVLWAPVE